MTTRPVGAVPAGAARLAIALAASGALAACGGGSSSSSSSPSPSPSGSDLVEHLDRQAGFAIVYPRSWHYFQTSDPNIQLRVGPDSTTSASVRLVAYASPVDGAAQQALVHQLLAPVTIVDEARVSVHGLSGWQEAYGVQSGGVPLVHIHIFLFEPNRVDTLIFETPDAQLKQYARVFDQMRDSFQPVGPVASPPAGAGSPAPPAAAPPSPAPSTSP